MAYKIKKAKFKTVESERYPRNYAVVRSGEEVVADGVTKKEAHELIKSFKKDKTLKKVMISKK